MPVEGGSSQRIHVAPSTNEWWRTAVIYQIYPRSFASAKDDGIGDLPGITKRLPYLRDLGVDAVWISPFYPSPQADAGYDVADYLDVDPLFGSLTDADQLIATAHELGLRVFFDVVPNHTSDEHAWFQEALAARPGSPERARYWFRDSDGLPNNWPSEFGGPAWSRVPDGQWYLHMFNRKQPDLNWDNPEVRAMFLDVLRFWLDRGVDGFRVDVAQALVKAEGLPDFHGDLQAIFNGEVPANTAPFYDQEGVHDIYRQWRILLDSYPNHRAMVAEAWVNPLDRLARYVRPDEFHQAFNFSFLQTPWNAADLRRCIIESLRTNDAVGAPATWVLSNHDVIRPASRLGFTYDHVSPWLTAGEPPPDLTVGTRRARAAAMLLLALPGSAYIYQGEELGLPEVIDLPADIRQDPTFQSTDGEVLGRDGCRVPLPWEKDAPGYGFGVGATTWLPQPDYFAELAVDQQTGRAHSTLELYRSLLRIRRTRQLAAGAVTLVDLGDDVLAFDISTDHATTRAVVNLGERDCPIPPDTATLIASESGIGDTLPTDHAVWLAKR